MYSPLSAALALVAVAIGARTPPSNAMVTPTEILRAIELVSMITVSILQE
jgi:hypothetical protein